MLKHETVDPEAVQACYFYELSTMRHTHIAELIDFSLGSVQKSGLYFGTLPVERFTPCTFLPSRKSTCTPCVGCFTEDSFSRALWQTKHY
jgi:hypothetical protein